MNRVDIWFKLSGREIPADHGYCLYSAVSQFIPQMHADDAIALHPIAGTPAGDRLLALTEKSSLIIRAPSDRIKEFLPLAGKALRLEGHHVQVGVPHAKALVPSPRLYTRLVVIKGFMDPDPFLEAVRRQLKEMDISGKPYLVYQPEVPKSNIGKSTGSHSEYLRRTIRIRDKQIVGFALRVGELTAEESIRLQEKGIGGRRRFGCGIFIPDRR